MLRIARLFIFLISCLCAVGHLAAQELSSYKLGAGDMISIRVLGEDDLKREKVRLSDAGTISFPAERR